MHGGIIHTDGAGDASSSSWIFGGLAHNLRPLARDAAKSFGFASESRIEGIAFGQPRERHHRGPHTETESPVFLIIAFPIDSARSLFLILFHWRKKGETRVKWVSIWSVKESDRILFGVLSVLVFIIGAWDLVSRKGWSGLYFSEDVVILGAWSVTVAYFTIPAR